MIALIIITAWWSYPQSMLFFLGALQTVPSSLKETVLIDGGGAWTSFWNVTFPFIRNSAVTVAIVLLMLYCQMVTMILVTTAGGPVRSTETMSMRVFNQLFTDFNLSGAASSAVLLFIINLVLTLVVINLRRKETIV
jgi:ABC-type sugar transport system permease subunit